MLEVTKLIVNYQMDFFSVLKIVIHSIPSFLIFVFPMSVMMGVLMALLRLSSDNEILAIKSGGIHIFRLLPPVLYFSIFGCLVTLFMTLYGAPASRLATKQLLIQVVQSNLNVGLKERTFNDQFKGVMLYVNKIDPKTGLLKHIFVQDQQDEQRVLTIIANRGKIISDNQSSRFQLQLNDGTINQVDQEQASVYSVHFDQYFFTLNLDQLLNNVTKETKKSFKEMSLTELTNSLKVKDSDYMLRLIAFHKNLPCHLPVLCYLYWPCHWGLQRKHKDDHLAWYWA
ncbi:MAG: permease YjgP/YjgQ family protein [Candidatus Magnetoglobus multicellularis str. Araruama]|uniref:Permease YjgP/YjgQ family protein n=1 Tax=Candidatus Magnetoglobus multicellularis str. Araruama TaxID=890399 RepID=A0A1V1P4K4_9BACT|nr:MAG: permease YjgP/YjgQ family protein [Candidatus Magnetoglobus multicellularis str. Araruama]